MKIKHLALILLLKPISGVCQDYSLLVRGDNFSVAEKCFNPKSCIVRANEIIKVHTGKNKVVEVVQNKTEELYLYTLSIRYTLNDIKYVRTQFCSLPPVCGLLTSSVRESEGLKGSSGFTSKYKINED